MQVLLAETRRRRLCRIRASRLRSRTSRSRRQPADRTGLMIAWRPIGAPAPDPDFKRQARQVGRWDRAASRRADMSRDESAARPASDRPNECRISSRSSAVRRRFPAGRLEARRDTSCSHENESSLPRRRSLDRCRRGLRRPGCGRCGGIETRSGRSASLPAGFVRLAVSGTACIAGRCKGAAGGREEIAPGWFDHAG